MPVEVIPNQPLKFFTDETFNEKNARLMWDRREYCQLVKTTQTQQFQLRVTEDSGTNIVANGGFTANLNGWQLSPNIPIFQWVAGKAQSTVLAQPNQPPQIYQTVPVVANRTYKLTYDFDYTGDPSYPTCMISLIVLLNSGTVIGGNGNNICDFIEGRGTYTIYFRANTNSDDLIFVLLNNDYNTRTVTLDNIRMVELTEPVLVLEDCNGNYIRDINTTSRFGDIITYTHSWDGLPDDGCYRLCLYGSQDLSLNYLDDAFCLTDHSGNCLQDENNNNLNEYIK